VIEVPASHPELAAFVAFHDTVHADRRAHWAPEPSIELPLLTGESPFAADRRLRPFVARENGRIVARAVAAIDERYNRLWDDQLGHILLFEALPAAKRASRELLEAACGWLARKGARAARDRGAGRAPPRRPPRPRCGSARRPTRGVLRSQGRRAGSHGEQGLCRGSGGPAIAPVSSKELDYA
jgi:hypothetical protein